MATDRELAERYWDEKLWATGWPADVEAAAKARYVAAVLALPNAVAELRALYADVDG